MTVLYIYIYKRPSYNWQNKDAHKCYIARESRDSTRQLLV